MIRRQYWTGHRPEQRCEYHFYLEKDTGGFCFLAVAIPFLKQPPGQRQAVAGELREGLNAVQNMW